MIRTRMNRSARIAHCTIVAIEFANALTVSTDRKIVWLRASGERWKNICWKIGLSRPAAWQRWSAALCAIAMKLNPERVPKHRSRVRDTLMRRQVGVGR
jgi:hypothetical protein